MAAGQGTAAPTWDDTIRWKFDSKTFWKDYNDFGYNPQTLMNRIIAVLQMVPSQWSGRSDIEGVPGGFKLLTGPDQSSMVSMTVTTDPEGEYSIVTGPTDGKYMPKSLKGKRSPWERSDIQEAIFKIFGEYVVEDEEATARNRARHLRGFAEASKGVLPDRPASNVASFLSGEKATAGPPQMQMELLRKRAKAPKYTPPTSSSSSSSSSSAAAPPPPPDGQTEEERQSAEAVAAMRGGRRKTKRSSKKRRTTRRR